MKTPNPRLTRAVTLALGMGSLAAVSGNVLAQHSDADTLAELQSQLRQLQEKIDRMEHQQQSPALEQRSFQALDSRVRDLEERETRTAPANVVTGGDKPGSFKLPGSNTSVSIGGYVKLDAIFNVDEDLGDTLFPGAVVTDPDADPDTGKFRFHARQTRLNIGTSTPTGMGELNTFIELDFFGSGGNEVFSNSSNFRIRHAYGEIGPLLAGQYWSNFMQFVAYPGTVDFGGPMGVSFIRQAQLRYSMPLGGGTLSVSAENPEQTGFANAQDEMPDFTARYAWSGGNAALEASTVLRRLAYDDGVNSDSEFGYGLLLAGNYSFGATKVMAGGIYGDGIGRYLYFASGSADGTEGIGAAVIDENGNLDTVEAYGLVFGIEQQWTPTFRSGLAYGTTRGRNPSPTSTKELGTFHFSNFWTPVDNLTFGLEAARAEQKLQNGDSGNAWRVQFATQVNF